MASVFCSFLPAALPKLAGDRCSVWVLLLAPLLMASAILQVKLAVSPLLCSFLACLPASLLLGACFSALVISRFLLLLAVRQHHTHISLVADLAQGFAGATHITFEHK